VAALIEDDKENSADNLDGNFVTAVFPSCVLGNGSFSKGEEDFDD
jgi:hypothetical protein